MWGFRTGWRAQTGDGYVAHARLNDEHWDSGPHPTPDGADRAFALAARRALLTGLTRGFGLRR